LEFHLIKSKQIDQLTQALWWAQQTMGNASKDSSNPFFNSNYSSLESVIAAVSNPLHDEGLLFTQLPGKGESAITVTTLIMHTSGQYIGAEVSLPMAKPPTAHELGSAITYLRRYGLAAICGIGQSDDDGNTATKGKSA
jgi:hypothetical protein